MKDYPTTLKDFKLWAKLMEDGAQVNRPKYKSTGQVGNLSSRRRRRHRKKNQRLKRKRRRHAD